MNSRRRYDTTALIQDLKTDRRKGIGLTIAAVVILLLLIGLYVSQLGGDTPEVPGNAAPSAVSPEEREKALENAIVDDGKPGDAAADPAEEEKTEPLPVRVQVLLPRKTELFVDDKSIGKVKSYEVELDAGAHVFKAKFGKRVITHEETLNPGAKVQVIFQPKKRKAVTKILEAGESTESPEG